MFLLESKYKEPFSMLVLYSFNRFNKTTPLRSTYIFIFRILYQHFIISIDNSLFPLPLSRQIGFSIISILPHQLVLPNMSLISRRDTLREKREDSLSLDLPNLSYGMRCATSTVAIVFFLMWHIQISDLCHYAYARRSAKLESH